MGEEKELYSKQLNAIDANWMIKDKLKEKIQVSAKTRYSTKESKAIIYPIENGKMKVEFIEPQRAITPGQSIVFYDGDIVKDFYGRNIPKPSHGTVTLDHKTSSFKTISQEVIKLYEKIANKNLFIKRINISANFLENKENVKPIHKQYDIFSLSDDFKEQLKSENEDNEIQNIVLDIKKRYGKNSILRGMDLEKGGTTIERNNQIGGHRR